MRVAAAVRGSLSALAGVLLVLAGASAVRAQGQPGSAASQASQSPEGNAAQAKAPAAPPVGAASMDDAATKKEWHMLGDYCEKCHNVTDWTGGIAFETMMPDDIPTDAKVWEAAVSKLRGRMMPPPGQKQPPQATIDSFVAFMQAHLDAAGNAHPDPGYVALHRLNRTEYARSVKSLLDVDVDPTQLLPKEVKSDDFDDIGDVLKVSPTFLDQYISAARTVAALAVGNPHAGVSVATFRAGRPEQAFHEEGLPLGTRGGMVASYNFPADGDYDFDIDVFTGVGYIVGLDYPNQVILTVDDQRVFERTIGGEADLKEQDQHPIEAAKDFKARFSHIRVHVNAGVHRIGATFVRLAHAESDDWLQPLNPMGGMDRVPGITGVQITGPHHPSGITETASRHRIFVCYPHSAQEELPCARRILATIARGAYRRPVTDEDLTAPLHFYERARAGKGFDAGIESALVAILANPKFLFRLEPPPELVKAGGIYHVSDLALASRLSFFLWNEGPDEELLALASANRLHDREVLHGQVRRMLRDPRAESLVTDFAFQWLEVDGMDKVVPDPVEYPEFDEALRISFREEMRLFLGSILLHDEDVRSLLTANWTYLNERLALHYGIPDVRGSQFRRVTLGDADRFGLLGKGAILMGTSYGNRTAPVLRGAWVLEAITGTPPHAPPPAIPPLKENVPGAKPLTIRERMQMHRQQASCNACHGVLDPLGLALENFDAMGRWQVKDRDAALPIDASGVLPSGQVVRGPVDLRNALMARPEQFVQTMTEKLMTYALGRNLNFRDMPVVRAIVRAAAHQDYRFDEIVLGIVDSPEFQEQHVPAAPANGAPELLTTQAANAPGAK